jgi:hypothetical protein
LLRAAVRGGIDRLPIEIRKQGRAGHAQQCRRSIVRLG